MTTPMPPDEQYRLLGEATKVVLEQAPSGWQRIIMDYLTLGGKVNVGASAMLADGRVVRLSPPRTLAPLFSDLRSGMYTQDVGTWYSFRLIIDPPDTFSVKYNYNDLPSFPSAPEREHFQREQERFPRSPENMPDWFQRGLQG
ncbi:hypothetical protein DI005_04565 [Prauserella sp. PE36]|uniref:DUF600 family protein n=1 Tax=Prauserella endophytica TaxID=1592324 RepID=A0ABY2RYE7_9PSEU|nr:MULTISPECIES: hypothetical protein [Prauserella]PXY24813.1 hypothetical protein BAY59_22375 [Prauserella coralliicola]RBM22916.1 hypothetical protein DI005_04565 [Prauserella sp. PE36]TKG65236.1 hypothetical protein FCN18_27400 [Prauserella endophytica]